METEYESPGDGAASDTGLRAIYDRMLAGDKAARDEVIEAAVPLAERVAKSVSKHRRNWEDDIKGEAYLALVEIVDWLPKSGITITDLEGLLSMLIRRHLNGDGRQADCIPVPRTTVSRHLKQGKKVPTFKQVAKLTESQINGFRQGKFEKPATIENFGSSAKSVLDDLVDMEESVQQWQAIRDACHTTDECNVVQCKLDGMKHDDIARKLGMTAKKVKRLSAVIRTRARDNYAAPNEGDSPAKQVALRKSKTGLSEACSDGTFALSA